MLSVRNAILASLVLMLIAFAGGAANLTGPPDSGGMAADSYGTHRDGYRAATELLSGFGVSVERRISPPDASLPLNSTLVIWGPHDDLVENEPVYLERLLPWIEQGGRLVVAPPPKVRSVSLLRGRPFPKFKQKRKVRSLWAVLGLDDLQITEGPELLGPDDAYGRGPGHDDDSDEHWKTVLQEATGQNFVPTSIVNVRATGDWKDLGARTKQLRVPSSGTGAISLPSDLIPTSQLECEHVNGSAWTLAAQFPRGRGEIVVIAEPMVLGNGQISEVDNAVLTFDLLRSGDRSVVFDEFYHGLSVRGKPLWLLTRPGAGLLVTALLLATVVWIWRQSFNLGPPLETVPRSRRVIHEYIDAMARFLTRSPRVKPYLLTEAREGVLRLLGAKLNLPPGRHEVRSVQDALARRSPVEAKNFQEALQQVDKAIQQRDRVTATSTIQAIQGLFRCL